MTRKIAGLLLVLCLISTNGSWAHHGGSLYDSSERITIHGAVADFRFVFPHVLIYIEAQNDDGQNVVWSGELTTPNRLTIEILVDDPVAFVEPWIAQREFNRVDWRIEENVCEDNASFATFENEVLEYGESPAE